MLKFIDLFCGGGFGARGATNAGAIPILALDSWDLATDTYKVNFPDVTVLNSLIEDVNPVDLNLPYTPDVILASPECTSHSIARGAKKGCERSRSTAFGILPWVEAFMPRWIVIENVNRMKQWDKHDYFINKIKNYGYSVSDLLLNAADYGAPQSRKRMFLLCDLYGTTISRKLFNKRYGKKKLAAETIIDWSGKYNTTPLYKKGRAEPTIKRAERAMASLGENVPFLIVYYGSDYAGGWQSLDTPLRTITTLDRFGLVIWDAGIPRMRMLQPDELVQAMTCGTIHNLPVGTRRQKVKLCGNGICSNIIECIFKYINETENSDLECLRN